MKQMWGEKKQQQKKKPHSHNHSERVEKSDTFRVELAAKVLLYFILSALKWHNEAKDDDKTSHLRLFCSDPERCCRFV